MGINYNDVIAILPMLVLSLGVVVMLLLEVFLKEGWKRGITTSYFIGAALLAAFYTSSDYIVGKAVMNGLVLLDPLSLFLTVIILATALLSNLLMISSIQEEGVDSPGEFYVLILTATLGAIMFVSAGESITLFLALEIMSLALYCLCGAAVGIRASSESAVKYFLLGSFASAFLLYGLVILYGVTGSTFLSVMGQSLTNINAVDNQLLLVGIGLVILGFAFKIGAVPFQFWTPDVYQGAPTSVTAYMACVVKVAAFGAMMRFMWTVLGSSDLFYIWSDAMWVIAVLTMTFGNLVALRQRSIKRMLAYSSIAHAGYMAVALLAPGDFGGGGAMLFYMVSYSLMTLGAFAVVIAVTKHFSSEHHPDDISRFKGLGTSTPFLGILMTLFMVGLAGLPPGFAGMLGKFFLFNAAIKGEYLGIAIIGVINSAISCYFYLRIIVTMYFNPDEKGDLPVHTGLLEIPALSSVVLIVCGVGTVLLGLFPSGLYNLANTAMRSLAIY